MEQSNRLQFPPKIDISNLPQPDMAPIQRHTSLNPKPTNWREECDKRGNVIVEMVKERKLLQQLILEHCLKLEEYGFECEAGPLERCEDYQQLKCFAAGVGHIKMPLLEDMPLHGIRGIKRMVVEADDEIVHAYLECGHTVSIARADYIKMDPMPTINATLPCDICIELLQAKNIYEHEVKDT